MSNRKQKKQIIECGFGENCARRTCTFKHPDSRNVDDNLRKFHEEQHKRRVALEQRQMEMIRHECYDGDSCYLLSCPYRHSPTWNPVENQRLVEEKRRRNELCREQQRKHALGVCYRESVDCRNEINEHQRKKNLLAKSSEGNDYQCDDEYFYIQEKVWKKTNRASMQQMVEVNDITFLILYINKIVLRTFPYE